MTFTDGAGKPLHVEDKRYHTKVGDYTDVHGVRELQDATKKAGSFLFSSGIHLRGLVLTAHSGVDSPPQGDATPEKATWDRIHSRAKRMYTGAEQMQAAGYLGNDNAPTLTQPYPRDTGEMAWDVAAPIQVKGKHFGGFRVGVARDRVVQQYRDLIVGLALLFSLIAVVFVGVTMWLAWRSIQPLAALSDRANELSTTDDPDVLEARIRSTDPTEVGDMARSLERLRMSLSMAMKRLGAHQGARSSSGRHSGDQTSLHSSSAAVRISGDSVAPRLSSGRIGVDPV
jgi:HAMP domain-containing protein